MEVGDGVKFFQSTSKLLDQLAFHANETKCLKEVSGPLHREWLRMLQTYSHIIDNVCSPLDSNNSSSSHDISNNDYEIGPMWLWPRKNKDSRKKLLQDLELTSDEEIIKVCDMSNRYDLDESICANYYKLARVGIEKEQKLKAFQIWLGEVKQLENGKLLSQFELLFVVDVIAAQNALLNILLFERKYSNFLKCSVFDNVKSATESDSFLSNNSRKNERFTNFVANLQSSIQASVEKLELFLREFGCNNRHLTTPIGLVATSFGDIEVNKGHMDEEKVDSSKHRDTSGKIRFESVDDFLLAYARLSSEILLTASQIESGSSKKTQANFSHFLGNDSNAALMLQAIETIGMAASVFTGEMENFGKNDRQLEAKYIAMCVSRLNSLLVNCLLVFIGGPSVSGKESSFSLGTGSQYFKNMYSYLLNDFDSVGCKGILGLLLLVVGISCPEYSQIALFRPNRGANQLIAESSCDRNSSTLRGYSFMRVFMGKLLLSMQSNSSISINVNQLNVNEMVYSIVKSFISRVVTCITHLLRQNSVSFPEQSPLRPCDTMDDFLMTISDLQSVLSKIQLPINSSVLGQDEVFILPREFLCVLRLACEHDSNIRPGVLRTLSVFNDNGNLNNIYSFLKGSRNFWLNDVNVFVTFVKANEYVSQFVEGARSSRFSGQMSPAMASITGDLLSLSPANCFTRLIESVNLTDAQLSLCVSFFRSPEIHRDVCVELHLNAVEVFSSFLSCKLAASTKALLYELLHSICVHSKSSCEKVWEALENQKIMYHDATSMHHLSCGNGLIVGVGLKYDFEELESNQLKRYPVTTAFLDLLQCLLTQRNKHSAFSSLGSGLRLPGLGPYFNFIVDDILSKLDQRRYYPENSEGYGQKYLLASKSIQILSQLLTLYKIETIPTMEKSIVSQEMSCDDYLFDFAGSIDEEKVVNGHVVRIPREKTPGFLIMAMMLNQEQSIRSLLIRLLEECIPAASFEMSISRFGDIAVDCAALSHSNSFEVQTNFEQNSSFDSNSRAETNYSNVDIDSCLNSNCEYWMQSMANSLFRFLNLVRQKEGVFRYLVETSEKSCGKSLIMSRRVRGQLIDIPIVPKPLYSLLLPNLNLISSFAAFKFNLFSLVENSVLLLEHIVSAANSLELFDFNDIECEIREIPSSEILLSRNMIGPFRPANACLNDNFERSISLHAHEISDLVFELMLSTLCRESLCFSHRLMGLEHIAKCEAPFVLHNDLNGLVYSDSIFHLLIEFLDPNCYLDHCDPKIGSNYLFTSYFFLRNFSGLSTALELLQRLIESPVTSEAVLTYIGKNRASLLKDVGCILIHVGRGNLVSEEISSEMATSWRHCFASYLEIVSLIAFRCRQSTRIPIPGVNVDDLISILFPASEATSESTCLLDLLPSIAFDLDAESAEMPICSQLQSKSALDSVPLILGYVNANWYQGHSNLRRLSGFQQISVKDGYLLGLNIDEDAISREILMYNTIQRSCHSSYHACNSIYRLLTLLLNDDHQVKPAFLNSRSIIDSIAIPILHYFSVRSTNSNILDPIAKLLLKLVTITVDNVLKVGFHEVSKQSFKFLFDSILYLVLKIDADEGVLSANSNCVGSLLLCLSRFLQLPSRDSWAAATDSPESTSDGEWSPGRSRKIFHSFCETSRLEALNILMESLQATAANLKSSETSAELLAEVLSEVLCPRVNNEVETSMELTVIVLSATNDLFKCLSPILASAVGSAVIPGQNSFSSFFSTTSNISATQHEIDSYFSKNNARQRAIALKRNSSVFNKCISRIYSKNILGFCINTISSLNEALGPLSIWVSDEQTGNLRGLDDLFAGCLSLCSHIAIAPQGCAILKSHGILAKVAGLTLFQNAPFPFLNHDGTSIDLVAVQKNFILFAQIQRSLERFFLPVLNFACIVGSIPKFGVEFASDFIFSLVVRNFDSIDYFLRMKIPSLCGLNAAETCSRLLRCACNFLVNSSTSEDLALIAIDDFVKEKASRIIHSKEGSSGDVEPILALPYSDDSNLPSPPAKASGIASTFRQKDYSMCLDVFETKVLPLTEYLLSDFGVVSLRSSIRNYLSLNSDKVSPFDDSECPAWWELVQPSSAADKLMSLFQDKSVLNRRNATESAPMSAFEKSKIKLSFEIARNISGLLLTWINYRNSVEESNSKIISGNMSGLSSTQIESIIKCIVQSCPIASLGNNCSAAIAGDTCLNSEFRLDLIYIANQVCEDLLQVLVHVSKLMDTNNKNQLLSAIVSGGLVAAVGLLPASSPCGKMLVRLQAQFTERERPKGFLTF